MNGEVARDVALTYFVNGAFRGLSQPVFFPNNSSTIFCESISFLRLNPLDSTKSDWQKVALAPDEWVRLLTKEGFQRAFLLHSETNDPGISDRMSSAFVGGGGRSLIAVCNKAQTDFWEGRSTVWKQDAPENRIWRIEYGMVESRKTDSMQIPTYNLNELMQDFQALLVAIKDFAVKHELDGFANCFATAIDCLQSGPPLPKVFHADIAPEGLLPLESRRLLFASQSAWVFGGMGSWNDLGFDGEEGRIYDDLSDRLYNTVNRAICAATNTLAESPQ